MKREKIKMLEKLFNAKYVYVSRNNKFEVKRNRIMSRVFTKKKEEYITFVYNKRSGKDREINIQS